MSDLKEEYTRALGLRRLTEQEKTMRLLQNAKRDEHGVKDLKKMSDRSTRKARPGNGVRPPLSPFFSNWKLAKKPKTSRSFSSKSPRKKRDDATNTSPVTTTSPPLQQQTGQNVLLLPKQNSPQQSTAVQQNIVVGQTIFQTPDGKKFILIPHNIAKPNTQGMAPVSKAHSQGQTPILPFASNIKIQSNSDADKTPQRFFYLPQSHSVLGTAVGAPSSSVAVGNAACTSVITSDTSQKNLDVDQQKHIGTEPIVQSNISPNIIHLLNMTKNMLSETKDPAAVVTVNSAIAQVPDMPPRLNPVVSLVSASSVNLVSVNPVTSRSLVNMVPACSIVPASSVVPARPVVPANSLIPVISSNLRTWSHPGHHTNQAVQVLKIRHSQASQPASSYAQQSQSPSTVFLESKSLSAITVASKQETTPIEALSFMPKAATNQVTVSVPMTGAQDAQIGVASVTGSKTTINTSIVTAENPTPTGAASSGANAVVPIAPAVSTQSINENPLKVLENSIASAIGGKNGLIAGIAVKDSIGNSSEASVSDGKRPSRDIADPDRNLRNAEANSVVIIGKKRKKAHGFKGLCTLGHRRYGGPPFVPCKAPPTPYTPSSSTCCLYEYTLLKMATRGFWGCEMGKLQDVFRSIRCESVDQDTVEDVTKRCYEFVQARLLQVGDDCKSMYRYMKNYIDEFDCFLDRVYPVAIIAMLIYLPTAADYSLVTWHGIPPTGWSEYRRAVVMREVFEVIYRFWNELGKVPDYKKEYFDCPNVSSLLVPRVFDLRQSYSDPTTCVVQKVPQGERVDSDSKSLETVNNSNVNIKHCKQYNEEEEPESDHMSKRASPNGELKEKEGEKSEESPAEELVERPKLISVELDQSFHEEGARNVTLMGDLRPNTDELSLSSKNSNETLDGDNDLLMTVKPRSESPTPLNFSSSRGSSPEDKELGKEHDALCCRENEKLMIEKPEMPICNGISDHHGDIVVSDIKKSGKTIVNAVWSTELISSANDNRFSYDSEAQDSLKVYIKDGVDLHEEVAKRTGTKKVISAKFAESIAAACGNSHNNLTWNETVGNEGCGETCTQTARSGTGSIVSTTPTTATHNFAHIVNGTSQKTATTASTRVSVQENSQITVQSYCPQDNASKEKGNRHNIKDLRDFESASQRRRTPRRLASSARFDLLVATDDVSLKRDIRKAIKLSKLDKAATRPIHASEEIHVNEEANDFRKSDRPPLKTALNCLEIDACNDEKCSPLESPINKLKKLKRSVAFEALWKQKSVEEPTVIEDEKVYSLGQYLENFPVETHCPAEKTIIRICNEDYNAREILGYLRRGTQLVEQIGKDVVIDTTRTVKSNSTILAVRKVPPGKISKLVHPGLHLENYTSYLLPLGIKQPLKGRKGPGRSTKTKRKSSITKEEVTIKTEPQSPAVSIPPLNLNLFEDSIASPPPEKITRFENSVDEEYATKIDLSMEIEAQGSKKKESKETQTKDQNGNFVSNLAALSNIGCMDSLEETLSTLMEASFSGLADSFAETNIASKDFFDNLIISYERAGNFLVNTAKMLKKLKLKTLHTISDS